MAPMQWPDATASLESAVGDEARQSVFEAVSMVQQGTVASAVAAVGLFSTVNVPSGLDLPCTEDPELFFAEAPSDVEQAKALCQSCRARNNCLEGALERREPWGVWGGELFMRGTIVPRKRPRGRPRKEDAQIAKADEQAA
jgi:WhiB family transcriptional regulator, redox-sensing transcriptional regulator